MLEIREPRARPLDVCALQHTGQQRFVGPGARDLAAVGTDDAALAEIAEAVLTAAVVGGGKKNTIHESASRNELPGHEGPLRFQGRRRRDDVGPSQRTGPYCFWKLDVIADQDRDAETGDIEHRVAVAWREPLGFESVGNA